MGIAAELVNGAARNRLDKNHAARWTSRESGSDRRASDLETGPGDVSASTRADQLL